MNLLLVVGSSRSGTTVTARALGRSDLVKTFDELHYVDELVPADMLDRPLSQRQHEQAWAALEWRLRHGLFVRMPVRLTVQETDQKASQSCATTSTAETGAALLLRFLSVNNDKPHARYVCEQTPQNLQHFRQLSAALPGVYAVCPVRDPRDVLLSQKNRWRRRILGSPGHSTFELVRNWINYQPVLLTLMWRRDAQLASRLALEDPHFHQFRFEDLVEAPARVLGELCSFLGIPFTDDMLDVPMVGSSISQDARDKAGIRPDVTGRWLQGLSHGEIWICERLAGKTMRGFGYQPSKTRLTLGAALALIANSIVRLPLMIPVNHRRVRAALRKIPGLAAMSEDRDA